MISEMYFNIGEKKKALDIAYESATNLPEDPEANGNFINIITFMVNDAGLVSEEQKNLYNHLMENWDTLFPEMKLFEKIPVESDFKTIKKKLEERRKYGQQLISMYERRQVPLALYSKQSGLNIYAVWKDLISSYLTKIFTYNHGTAKEQYELINNSKRIVIDPFSFFTLYELNLHTSLISIFDEIYLTQGLLDKLVQHKAELDISSVQGQHTIGIAEGKIFRTEVSAEDVKKEILKLEEMINYIKSFIRGNKKSFVDDRIVNMIEKSSVQSINLSLELNIPLVCDDSLLNDLTANEFSFYKYSSSLWLIRMLLDRNVINIHQYNNIVLNLVSMNYYFVPLSADILLEGIEGVDFNDYSINKRAIDNFRDIHQDRNTAFFVIADFIIKIYFNKKLAVITRDNWVDYILNAITINDSDAEKTFEEIKSIVIKSAEETKRNLGINDKIIKDFIDWINKIFGMR